MLGFLLWLAVTRVTAIAFRGDYRTLIDFAITSPKLMFQTRATAFYVAGKADIATTKEALKAHEKSRILLLSATYADDSMTALIIGNDGTRYAVVFSDSPSCSCDAFTFKREAQCKHLAWLKMKVLGIPPAHYLITQTSYLAVEVAYILSRPRRAAVPGALIAPRPIREALGVIPKEPVNDSSASACNICDDELTPSQIVLCAATCRYAVCDPCVKRYHKNLAEEGKPPICPGCRSPWVSEISVHAVTLRTRKQTLKVTHPFGSRAASRRGRAASRRRV